MSEQPPTPTIPSERQTAIYLAAHNAVTLELSSSTEPDEDGHIVTGTVLRRSPPDPTLVPVRARVAHGVAPSTAAAMLRKMADLLEQNPGFLSAEPGAAVRRLADGTSVRKRLTPEAISALAMTLEPAERDRLTRLLDQIRPAITEEPEGPAADE
ncbi:MAG: hypothetical protein R3B49_06420 [Phycisphaerales bacterium]